MYAAKDSNRIIHPSCIRTMHHFISLNDESARGLCIEHSRMHTKKSAIGWYLNNSNLTKAYSGDGRGRTLLLSTEYFFID